ncbi:MAG: AmmeMemoRadiSam system protein B [Candidatus Aenigmarchaeota archaeon]|nr:AmmeMemoRadiSam system protein B [Candidatus Aenigmarchaeota archaeon]
MKNVDVLIRKPAVAGMFYPAEKEVLEKQINRFLEDAKCSVKEKPKAIIIPHAGYVYSGQIAAIGYKIISKYVSGIQNVIIIGPSHHAEFDGCVMSSADAWETPSGTIAVNKNYISPISDIIRFLDQPHKKEHSIEVQVPFIQAVLPRAKIVPILTGHINPEKLAKELDKYISEKDMLVISTDLSHYHSYDEARKIDAIANNAIPSLDIKNVEAGVEACGKTGVLSCMHLARIHSWKGEMLGYATSGDTAGDKKSVVGYGCYGFY